MRKLHAEILNCEICREHLPLGPRPVVQFSPTSKVVIIGQAPGTRVHETGIPWDDPSGEHLREWMAVPREQFYRADLIALVPMGFCYPGKASGGDAPPRPECAPAWHGRIFEELPSDPLILLCGMYAQKAYLGSNRKKTLTETVRSFTEYGLTVPLPHPSWRSRIWMKKNPWFASDLLPALRSQIRVRLSG